MCVCVCGVIYHYNWTWSKYVVSRQVSSLTARCWLKHPSSWDHRLFVLQYRPQKQLDHKLCHHLLSFPAWLLTHNQLYVELLQVAITTAVGQSQPVFLDDLWWIPCPVYVKSPSPKWLNPRPFGVLMEGITILTVAQSKLWFCVHYPDPLPWWSNPHPAGRNPHVWTGLKHIKPMIFERISS